MIGPIVILPALSEAKGSEAKDLCSATALRPQVAVNL